MTLKAARVNANLSILDVSKKLNVSRNMVYRYESGKTSPPLDKLIQMLELYDCRIEDINLYELVPLKAVERM